MSIKFQEVSHFYEKAKKKNWSLKFISLQVVDEPWIHEKFNRLAKDNMPSSFCQKAQLDEIQDKLFER